jgi:hypothetical protein
MECVRAYGTGVDTTARAPVALPIAVGTMGLASLCTLVLDGPTPMRRNPAAPPAIAGLVLAGVVTSRGEPRRARALGLDAATAPVPGMTPAFAMQGLIALGHLAWVWRRTGRRPRVGGASVVAASIVAEFARRRAWKRALAAVSPPAGMPVASGKAAG